MKKRVVGFVATVAMVMMMCTSVFAADTYSVIGLNNDWNTDVDMTDVGGGKYEVTIDLPAGSHEYKVRADHAWDESWGAANGDGVTNAPGGGNNTLELAADSKVKFTFDTSSGDNTKFTVTATPVTGDEAPAAPADGAPSTGDTVPFAAVAAIVAMLAMGYSAVALKKTR